ncbi:hypothetical protein DB30_05740 [Enhygromyxa salina]|uniref:Protein kinase domain-containing protein n=1 Tax=Enhygromyxa salina TaxID=215803 RepID=A0A0C1ZW94_9BACT|nr:hypothetical protein [Enhygromyxa salina]KIG15313.1 hypothetical protein DB30_05740 [Enhygromyxa salina]
MSVWLGRERVDPRKLPLLGVGGEAEVFGLPDGRALKLFKGPDHPDLTPFPEQRDAAAARLELHQRKLHAFPTGLPQRVVQPQQLAVGGLRRRRVLGYAMRRIDGAEPLMSWGNPRRRRAAISAARVVDMLLDLHRTLCALHQRGVVIGDFNDLNVLLASDGAAWLIDADSFMFAGFGCAVFTERFVDPLLCDPNASAPVLVKPHNHGSDWYAFTIMLMRTLLCVGPYGGVFRPALGGSAVVHAARPLRRISVFDDRVVYPKPALPLETLPDELLEFLRAVFTQDRRDPVPLMLLEDLAFARCRSCGLEHARARCPACTTTASTPASASGQVAAPARNTVRVKPLLAAQGRILAAALDPAGQPRLLEREGGQLWIHEPRGRVSVAKLASAQPPPRAAWLEGACAWVWSSESLTRATPGASPASASTPIHNIIDTIDGAPAFACHGERRVWISGGRLLTDHTHGPRELGRVLPNRSRVWLGPSFGLALYSVGALAIPATFDPTRPGLSDRHTLAPVRGRLVHAVAQLSSTHAWLFRLLERGPSLRARLDVLGRDASVLGSAEFDADDPASPDAWIRSLDGAAAVGSMLLVPTDAGIVRVELVGGRPELTRSFPATAPFVDAASTLLAGPLGLLVVDSEGVRQIQFG